MDDVVFWPWSPEPDLNRRPRPYQGRALPTELSGQTKDVPKNEKEGRKCCSHLAPSTANSRFAGKSKAQPRFDNIRAPIADRLATFAQDTVGSIGRHSPPLTGA